MKKFIKRSISILLCLVTCFAFTIVSSATDLGELTYWYSDDDRIGWWTSTPSVYRIPLNSSFSSVFVSGIAWASSQWGNVDGIGFNYATSQSNADILCYGGTITEIQALGIDIEFSSADVGSTKYNNPPKKGTFTYGTETKRGYELVNPIVFILDKDRTLNKVKKTSTHEMGHALGWYGHSTNTSDVMCQDYYGIISLSNRDKQHLAQVY